jgi:PDZ domain-containing protein/aspartyl protease
MARSMCCFLLSISCLLSGNAAAGRQRADVVLPFELDNRTVFVRVIVAERPLWFVLDTGDKFAVIDLSIAKSLGLKLGSEIPVNGGGAETVHGYLLIDAPFKVSQLPDFQQPLFITVPLAKLAELSGHEFAGILGFDFINEFAVEIDYLARHLILHDKEAYSYDGTGERLPISFNNAGHPQLSAELMPFSGPPIQGKFTLDIGSGAAVILNSPYVDQRGFLKSDRPTVPWLEGEAFGGLVPARVGRLRALKLGSYVINDPVTVFSRAKVGPFASSENDGNIGAAVWDQFKIILDYGHQQIILEPNDQFGKYIEYNRSGLVLAAAGDNFETVTVNKVAHNSPASEAGIRAGDLLVSIDGRTTRDISLSLLRSKLQDAQECSVVLKRAGIPYSVRLKLRSLI